MYYRPLRYTLVTQTHLVNTEPADRLRAQQLLCLHAVRQAAS